MADRSSLAQRIEDAGSSGVAAADRSGSALQVGDDVPVVVQSVTKLVVALATGAALSSVGDAISLARQPVGRVLDEWAGDERGAVDVIDLLAHCAGLVPVPPHELEAAADPTSVALASDFDPAQRGEHHYSNANHFIVAEVVRRLTGAPIDEWVDRLVEPTDHPVSWHRSADGTPWVHGGLVTTAATLAAVGALALPHDGSPSPLSTGWVPTLVQHAASAYPQPAWVDARVTRRLVRSWTEAGVDDALIAPLGAIPEEGLPIETVMTEADRDLVSTLGAAVHSAGLRIAEVEAGPVVGWGHDGDGGQWLVVCPERGVSVAHTRAPDHYGRPSVPPLAVLDVLDAPGPRHAGGPSRYAPPQP